MHLSTILTFLFALALGVFAAPQTPATYGASSTSSSTAGAITASTTSSSSSSTAPVTSPATTSTPVVSPVTTGFTTYSTLCTETKNGTTYTTIHTHSAPLVSTSTFTTSTLSNTFGPITTGYSSISASDDCTVEYVTVYDG